MKFNNSYNKIQKIFVVLFISSILTTPFVSFAQTRKNSNFCNDINRVQNTVTKRLAGAINNGRGKNKSQIERFNTIKESRKNALQQHRTAVDTIWNKRINKLKDISTPEQIDAIGIFTDTVDSLLKERRSKVDEAIYNFETEIIKLRDERTDTFNDLTARYRVAVDDAFNTAHQSCDNGAVDMEVQAQLRTDLTQLRIAFIQERNSHNFRTRVKNLSDERKRITQEAKETFKTGFNEAKEILKKSFTG